MIDSKLITCTGCVHFSRSSHHGTCQSCLSEYQNNPDKNMLFYTPMPTAASAPEAKAPEYTGGSVSYYRVQITNPTSDSDAYLAECNDIIEALGMNYAEGNAFKAIWRKCAARTLGKAKAGYEDGLYDAEKVVFFGQRMVSQEKYHGR